ncbi:helix-turn-helix domain-containing protein [Micromonospora sp. CPCC 206061]|uniref:helix-turn-helix domain-containing protein n=1 Tax=Micromonospora sp. CPCC 206061 TaxID=3122410 RepID=UPI002FF3FC56
MDNLSTGAQQVLDALAEIGQGTVAEIREKTGKAKSTTDKAIRELTDAGLIVETDPGDGNPARWSITASAAEPTSPDEALDTQPGTGTDAAQREPVDPVDTSGTGQPDASSAPLTNATDTQDAPADPADDHGDSDAPADDSDTPTEQVPARPKPPADRKVLAVAGVLGDYPDGATIDEIAEACGFNVGVVARLLQAMEQADAARRILADAEAGTPERWQPGPGKASEVDPNPEPPRCLWCQQTIRGTSDAVGNAATLQSLARPDGTIHVIAPDGTERIINLPKRAPARTPGVAATTGRSSASGTVNSDGNEPLGRGVLRGWVAEFINARPGHDLTPGAIAEALGAQYSRTISTGAVLNNCRTLAMNDQIRVVRQEPFTVTANKPADNSDQQ